MKRVGTGSLWRRRERLTTGKLLVVMVTSIIILIVVTVSALHVASPYERTNGLCVHQIVRGSAGLHIDPKAVLFARKWSPYYDEEEEKIDKAAASGDSRLETRTKLQPLLYKEKQKPILVVGSTGQVGQRIVRQLLNQVKYFPVWCCAKLNPVKFEFY